MAGVDTATWAALSSWVLVVGTLIILYWQTRQAQRLHSANAVMALRERFESPRSRVARRQLAKTLLTGNIDEYPNLEVPMFFELLGVLTHRGALDKQLVWNAFGGWITNYFYAIRHPVDRLARAREMFHDPLVFAEFEWLSNEMLRVDRKRLGKAHKGLVPMETEYRLILGAEARLEGEPI